MLIISRNKQDLGIIKKINYNICAFFLFREMINVHCANVLDIFVKMYESVHHIKNTEVIMHAVNHHLRSSLSIFHSFRVVSKLTAGKFIH